jgi:D-alanyl-D-alanine carboxypeptidase
MSDAEAYVRLRLSRDLGKETRLERRGLGGLGQSRQLGVVLSSVLIVGLLGVVVLTYSVAFDRTTNRGGGHAGATVPTATLVPDAASIDAPIVTKTPQEETVEQLDSESQPGSDSDDQPRKPDRKSSDIDGITAQAIFVLNATTGETLRADNEHDQRAIASLTKMMTALVIADEIDDGALNLDDEVTIQASDTVDAEVYSHMGLVVGDTVTIQQLLDGMLIPSGNDAAITLARVAEERISSGFGDENSFDFVQAMNDKAAELGLQDTHFSNPDGDDDPENYSSAHDLAVMAQAVLGSDLLAPIVGTGSETLTSLGPEQREYGLYNTNQLLGFGFDGVKTGTTDAAGSCVVSSTTLENGDRVIIVVLGSEPDSTDPEVPPADWPRYADTLSIYNQLISGE